MVFRRIVKGLKKTRDKLASGLSTLLGGGRQLDEDLLDELEETLYTSDLGATGTEIVEEAKRAWKRKEIVDVQDLKQWLHAALLERLSGCTGQLVRAQDGPTVLLVAGVNGSGKTTSIAKLAYWLKQEGNKVILCASDTFRAAAVEQLTHWADRIGVDIVKQGTGADPAAVAYDAVDAAVAREADYLIVDTAGRLHTQKNLMRELEKIVTVIRKRIPDAPHETILVLDATTGQNAIRQAAEFSEVAPISGLILSKLDGTAKGGSLFGIRRELGLPIFFVGLGEGVEDIEVFDPKSFVDGVLGDHLETEEAAG